MQNTIAKQFHDLVIEIIKSELYLNARNLPHSLKRILWDGVGHIELPNVYRLKANYQGLIFGEFIAYSTRGKSKTYDWVIDPATQSLDVASSEDKPWNFTFNDAVSRIGIMKWCEVAGLSLKVDNVGKDTNLREVLKEHYPDYTKQDADQKLSLNLRYGFRSIMTGEDSPIRTWDIICFGELSKIYRTVTNEVFITKLSADKGVSYKKQVDNQDVVDAYLKVVDDVHRLQVAIDTVLFNLRNNTTLGKSGWIILNTKHHLDKESYTFSYTDMGFGEISEMNLKYTPSTREVHMSRIFIQKEGDYSASKCLEYTVTLEDDKARYVDYLISRLYSVKEKE